MKIFGLSGLLLAGVTGIVTSVVMARKVTGKAKKAIDIHKETIESIHLYEENGLADENLEYTHEDAKRDTKNIRLQTTAKLAKLYSPVIGLCIISSCFVLKGVHR